MLTIGMHRVLKKEARRIKQVYPKIKGVFVEAEAKRVRSVVI
jgi:hypothetical protein